MHAFVGWGIENKGQEVILQLYETLVYIWSIVCNSGHLVTGKM